MGSSFTDYALMWHKVIHERLIHSNNSDLFVCQIETLFCGLIHQYRKCYTLQPFIGLPASGGAEGDQGSGFIVPSGPQAGLSF